MRILFLATWFPVPADNGSKLRTAALLRSLCERHRVTLVGFDFATAEPDAPSDLLAQCEAVHTMPLDPFEVNAGGTLRQFLALSPLFARPIPAMSQLVQRLSAETDFDVVIASTETMAPYAFLLPDPTLRVLEEHNCLTRWLQERETGHGRGLSAWRYRLSTAKARRFEASLFKRFDLVTMVSQPDRDVAQALAPQTPVRMIQNGVDTDFNQPNVTETRPRSLVYNGALTYAANFDAMQTFLQDSYPRIRAELPDVSLTITGSTEGVDVSELLLNESVTLTGFVDDVRLPVAAASACVVPLRHGGGTRLKILEAMALGTPVISTSKGAEGLSAVPGRDLLIADTPEALADETVRVLTSPELAASLASNARQRVVESYDWRPIGQQFRQLIERFSAEKQATSPPRPSQNQRQLA